MSGPLELSIVIPAYGEAERLPNSLEDIRRFFSAAALPMEVIVIVEKSEDDTLRLGRSVVKGDPRFRIIDNHVHRGKGYAVRAGMLMAGGQYVFYMDADLSTPLKEIPVFLEHFATHHEFQVLIGSRAHPQSRILRRQHPVRERLGKMFNKMVQMLAMKGIKDTQCGFKAFRAEACREIFSRQKLNGFAFDVEVLILARELGYRVDILPVQWADSGESRVHMLYDSIEMMWNLFRVRRLVRKTLQVQPPPASGCW